MPKNSFRDPVTNQLKCHGYVDANAPGDIRQEEADDFSLNPIDGWKWSGISWVPFPPPWEPVKAVLLATARADREKTIGRLSAAAGRLHRAGILADALLCDAAADALVNLPKRADVVAAANAVQLQAAVDAGYATANTGLPPAGKNAFKELDK